MRKTSLVTILFAMLITFLSACKSDSEEGGTTGKPYDPNQPIKLTSFYPENGGMATKVIINGENFGTDLSQIKVFYNEKQAAVVRSIGTKIYVITPRQPGDNCTITVEVGKDKASFEQQFSYKTQVTVSTITGTPRTEVNAVDGTLAAAQFGLTHFVCVDREKNIFVCERSSYRLRQINEQQNMVTTLATNITAPFIPMVETEGQKVFLPLWVQGGNLLQFDPETQWAKKQVKPQNVTLDQYISAAVNPEDKLVYIKALNGNLAKMDPKSKEAELVTTGLDAGWTYDAICCFDSLDPDVLYICYRSKHCIYRYELSTGNYELYAGAREDPGYEDGKRLNARFNFPSQICFDLDGIMYIADSSNHCIRSIDREGAVSTVIGVPGRAGYVDGTPDDALFNEPWGVAVDEEGTIYIADTNNKCIRKLAIQEPVYHSFNMRKLYIIQILLLCCLGVMAQKAGKSLTISGIVVDKSSDKEPIIGANIFLKDRPGVGTTTDLDGRFKVQAHKGDVLIVNYIGYDKIEYFVTDSQTNLVLKMTPSATALDEVVVVGMGTQRKVSVVGAITSVDIGDLAVPATSLNNSLGGRVPGVISIQSSGEPGKNISEFWVRGIGTFGANSSALVLIDGLEGDLSQVDPADVESFSVLKDASATAVYGVRGANGVILVTTKRGTVEKLKITARANFTISQLKRLPKYLRAYDYAKLANEARVVSGEKEH